MKATAWPSSRLPVRVLAALGIQTLIVTNAAGGLNPDYRVGDVMADRRPHQPDGAGRPASACAGLPDSHRAACARGSTTRSWSAGAEQIARRGDFHAAARRLSSASPGPSYETRAEYRAFRRLGGDCVGMSTVPEVLAAAGCGLRVLGLSTVTNVARPDAPQIVSAEEVVEVAATALPKVRQIVQAWRHVSSCASSLILPRQLAPP